MSHSPTIAPRFGGPPRVPEARFEDGRLRLPDAFGVTVIRPWPAPAAWRSSGTWPWKRVIPRIVLDELHYLDVEEAELRTVPVEDRERREHIAEYTSAWLALHAAIPVSVRATVSRFETEHWRLLSLLARCDGAQQLASETPALALCLASSRLFRRPPVKRPLCAARRLLRRGDLAVLRWLGFPASAEVLKILRKVQPGALNTPCMLLLRRCLLDGECAGLLAEIEAINSGVIRIVAEPELRHLFSAGELVQLCLLPEREGVEIAWGLKRAARLQGEVDTAVVRRARFLRMTELPTSGPEDTPF